jgi:hypothetical protein
MTFEAKTLTQRKNRVDYILIHLNLASFSQTHNSTTNKLVSHSR